MTSTGKRVRQACVGHSGPATFDQTGGTDTTQALVLNGPSGRYATYSVTGGTVVAAATVNVQQPSAGGLSVVNEGTPYTLALSGSSAGANSITSWGVGWGDGSADTLPGNPSSAVHTYTAGGQTYDITPTAYGGGKSYPAGTVPVLVNDVPADVTAPASLSNAVGQATDLSATFTDPGVGETHTALVQWGDGTTSTATVTTAGGVDTVTASYTYPLHGTYAATLTVVDSGGATAIVPFTVAVAYVPPAVSIAASATVAGGATTLTLHDGGPEAASAVTGWAVDWGVTNTDGTEDVQSVTTQPDADGDWVVPHVYGSTGTYNVHATAIDAEGSHDAGWTTASVVGPGPTGLTTAAGPDGVSVSWSDADPAATTFSVQRSTDEGAFTEIGTVPATGPGSYSFTDAQAAAGTAYAYQVVAEDGAGDQDASDPSAVTVPLPAPSLTATAASGGEVDLSWSDPSAPADAQFEVDRQDGGGGDWQALTVTGDDSYADTEVAGQTEYDYRVQATTDDAVSDYGTASVTTPLAVPAAPTGLSPSATSPTTVGLTWAAGTGPGGAAVGFAVGVSSDGGQTYAPFGGTLSSATTALTVTGLAPGTTYLFQVTAVDAAGPSESDGPVGARTLTPAPGSVLAVTAVAGPTGTGSATVTWLYSADDVGFEVEQEDQTANENYQEVTMAGPGSGGTYTADGLVAGDTYGFQVRADRADGTVSDYASGTVTLPPGEPTPTGTGTYYPPIQTRITPLEPVGTGTPAGTPIDTIIVTFTSPYPIDLPPAGQAPSGGGEVPTFTFGRDDAPVGVSEPFTPLPVTAGPDDGGDPGNGGDGGGGYGDGGGDDEYTGEVDTGPLTAGATYSGYLMLADPDSGGYYAPTLDLGEAPDASDWSTPFTFTVPGTLPAAPTLAAGPADADGSVTVDVGWPQDTSGGGQPSEIDLYRYTSGGTDLIDTVAAGSGDDPVTIPPYGGGGPSSVIGVFHYPGGTISDPTLTPLHLDEYPQTPPAASGLSATYVPREQGVDLHWLDNSHAEGGFDVERSVDDVTFAPVGQTGPDDNEYLDPTAGPDSVYYYRVRTDGSAGYTNVVPVNTPGLSVAVDAPLDPMLNPDLPINSEDANGDGTPDYEEPGPIAGETQLVPVTIDIPLGADLYGSATLTWSSAIHLWSDADKDGNTGGSPLGTLSGTSYTMPIDLSVSAHTYYAEETQGSHAWGDQFMQVSADLSLNPATPQAAGGPANPTTQPSTTQNVSGEGVTVTLTNLSDAKTGNNALIGQKLSLNINYAGPRKKVGGGTFNWSFPSRVNGSPFKVYLPDGSGVTYLTTADRHQRSVPFRFSQGGAPGNSVPSVITCNGTLYGYAFGTNAAMTTENVWTPSFSWTQPTIGPVLVNQGRSFAGPNGGAVYNLPVVSLPAPFGNERGNVAVNQLVNPQTSGQTTPSGPMLHLQGYNQGWGLDNFPFLHLNYSPTWLTGAQPLVPGDGATVGFAGLSSATFQFDFVTTLMFQPAPGSWVPLSSFTWFYKGSVTWNGTSWTPSGLGQNATKPLAYPASSITFPSWKPVYHSLDTTTYRSVSILWVQ